MSAPLSQVAARALAEQITTRFSSAFPDAHWSSSWTFRHVEVEVVSMDDRHQTTTFWAWCDADGFFKVGVRTVLLLSYDASLVGEVTSDADYTIDEVIDELARLVDVAKIRGRRSAS